MMVTASATPSTSATAKAAARADNPYGNAWIVKETPFSVVESAEHHQPAGRPVLKIANNSKLNPVGQPVAYKLMPGDNVFPFYQPDASDPASASSRPSTSGSPNTTPMRCSPRATTRTSTRGRRSAAVHQERQQAGGRGRGPLVHHGCASRSAPEEWPVMPVKYIGFTSCRTASRREPGIGRGALTPGAPRSPQPGTRGGRKWPTSSSPRGLSSPTSSPGGGAGLRRNILSMPEVLTQSVANAAQVPPFSVLPAIAFIYAGNGAWLTFVMRPFPWS